MGSFEWDFTNFDWPQKGDDPFFVSPAHSDPDDILEIEWLKYSWKSYNRLSETYKEAGDQILSEIKSKSIIWQKKAELFVPVSMLYRHSIELKIKSVIHEGAKLFPDIHTEEGLREANQEHSLHKLWNITRPILERAWKIEDAKTLDASGKIIMSFHSLDPRGQAFRYLKDVKGNYNLESYPDLVDIKHYQKIVNAIFNFLSGCEMGLVELQENNQ